MNKLKYFLILSLASFLFACSARVPVEQTFKGKDLQIGSVEVVLDETGLDEQREDVFDRVDGLDSIKEEVITILNRQNLYNNASQYALHIEIDNFKLRHGATKFFVGGWSGSDYLGADVKVKRGNRAVYGDRVEVSGGNGNPFNISRESRSSGLIHGFAKKVVILLTHRKFDEEVSTAEIVVPQKQEAASATAPKEVKREAVKKMPPVKPMKSSSNDKCTLDQILTMKNAGLTDDQIKKACDEKR